ncbi:hypothetical protein E4U32_002685 [Claviceps aff. humidiphila group G2b]|nr:hypothetical protein E4U32_002685 [Claviceps aff. humidiphila group G2b]
MFAFDQALLPQLNTRKALILVDFQNDFIESDGAFPATDPEGFVDRTARLISDFRGKGDVVWVQSQFDSPVPADTETIIVSDTAPITRHQSNGWQIMAPIDPGEPPDEEAFLSQEEATCAKAGSWGVKMNSAMEDVMQKRDTVITKNSYSGFNSTSLLRSLRAKMVMEVFICGSMANVGVYATALDAAGHGMSITIVEDCCGYRSEQRQLAAMRNLIELTGCEIASSEEIIETLQSSAAATPPQPPRPAAPLTSPSGNLSTSGQRKEASDNVANILNSLARLRLDAKRSETATGDDNQASPTEPHKSRVADQQGLNDGSNEGMKEAADQQQPSKLAHFQKDDDGSAVPTGDRKFQRDEDDVDEAQHSHERTGASRRSQKRVGGSSKRDENTLQKGLGEGDTSVIDNLLPLEVEKSAFEKLSNEVQWQRMMHLGGEVPRLVAVQGEVSQDGSRPVYRHPSDESLPLLPFSPTVLTIKEETEKHLGHAINHVLIQFYRDGNDYISEHSDKTIDVVKGSYIANVSIGAERTMVFRTKRQGNEPSLGDASPPCDVKRHVQRARLPHNSLCRLGLKTNMKWLHSIRQDKRAERDKTPAEMAQGGSRISLTFRHIGTFLDKDEQMIWGQGATGKTRDAARPVINGQSPQAIKMLKAFGAENNSSVFDWEAYYGKGFDVLHMKSSPRFFASADMVANMRVWLMLADLGVNYAKGSIAPSDDVKAVNDGPVADFPIRFVDNDEGQSTVDGDVAILLYLNDIYGQASDAQAIKNTSDVAARYSRLQRALTLGSLWKRQGQSTQLTEKLRFELAIWDGYAAETEWMSNASVLSIVDYAVWPVLYAVLKKCGRESLAEWKNLHEYYRRVAERESTKKVLGQTG